MGSDTFAAFVCYVLGFVGEGVSNQVEEKSPLDHQLNFMTKNILDHYL